MTNALPPRKSFQHRKLKQTTRALPWRQFVEDYATRRQSISGEFLDAMLRLVQVLTRNKPASIYSPLMYGWRDVYRRKDDGDVPGKHGNVAATKSEYQWEKSENDGYKTIVVDVLTDQVKRGHLLRLYYANKTAEDIYRHLRTAVIWWLHKIADGRGTRTLALYQAIRNLLEGDKVFFQYGKTGWGLSDWQGQEWNSISESDLAGRLELINIPRPRSSRGKASIIPAQTELGGFIAKLLDAVGYPLPLKRIVQLVEVHLDVFNSREDGWPICANQETGNEEPFEYEDLRSSPSWLVISDQIEDFVGNLSPRDLYMLKEYYLGGKTLRELELPWCKKSSLSNEKGRIDTLLRQLSLPRDPDLLSRVDELFIRAVERRVATHDSPNRPSRHRRPR